MMLFFEKEMRHPKHAHLVNVPVETRMPDQLLAESC